MLLHVAVRTGAGGQEMSPIDGSVSTPKELWCDIKYNHLKTFMINSKFIKTIITREIKKNGTNYSDQPAALLKCVSVNLIISGAFYWYW